jgi:hypothetical protein
MMCEQCKKIVDYTSFTNGKHLCKDCVIGSNVPVPGDMICEHCKKIARFTTCVNGRYICDNCCPPEGVLVSEPLPSLSQKSMDLRFVRREDGSLVLQQNLDKPGERWEDVPIVEELSCSPTHLDTGEIWRRHQCAEDQQEFVELEARLKEALDVLHDIVVLLRKEPAVQGPRFSDLGFRASSILSKNGR